jgi:hypothetical protein
MIKAIVYAWRKAMWVAVIAEHDTRATHGWMVKTEADALRVLRAYRPEWKMAVIRRGKLLALRGHGTIKWHQEEADAWYTKHCM